MATKPRRPKGTGGIRNRGTKKKPRYFIYHYVWDADGRHQVSEGPYARKEDAESALNDEMKKVNQGVAIAPSKLTVAEMLDRC